MNNPEATQQALSILTQVRQNLSKNWQNQEAFYCNYLKILYTTCEKVNVVTENKTSS